MGGQASNESSNQEDPQARDDRSHMNTKALPSDILERSMQMLSRPAEAKSHRQRVRACMSEYRVLGGEEHCMSASS